MIRLLKALWAWLQPTEIYTVTGAELGIALRRAGYTPSFRRLPAAAVRACASKPQAR